MTKKKNKKSAAKILKKPIHDQTTRKVSALPELIAKSERPDGKGVETVEEDPGVKGLSSEASIPDGGLFDDLFSDPEED